MRIRKHARVSAPPISPSSDTPSTDVCELNRPPWDALSDQPQSQLERQVVIVDNNGGGIESADYAPDSLVALKKQFVREEVVKKIKKEVEEDDESGLSLMKIVKEKEKKRINKVKREIDNYRKCSRNDGKKWHCKNMAKEGHTLCEHHLTKHKFYSNNHATKCLQTKCPPRKYVKKAKAAKTTSPTEFYYYSGFGPWWGRKRGESAMQRDKLEDSGTANQATSSSSLVNVEHRRHEYDCRPDYFDFDDEESSQEEEEKKMGKRRQSPIKARSLKSLL